MLLTNCDHLYILNIYRYTRDCTEGDGANLTIIIENTSPLPIYEQIIQQVRAQILSGQLKEGEMLPSIRALARDLRISVITTRRAYDELEREGYIQTVAGRGSFVGRRSAELVREENLRRIEQLLGEALQLAGQSGIEIAQLEEMLRLLAETEEQKG